MVRSCWATVRSYWVTGRSCWVKVRSYWVKVGPTSNDCCQFLIFGISGRGLIWQWGLCRWNYAMVRSYWIKVRSYWVMVRSCWATVRSYWVTVRSCWVTGRSCWVKVGPTSNDCCPYEKRRKYTQRDKQRRPCDDVGRGQSYATTSQGTLGSTRSWKKPGRKVSSQNLRGNVALPKP